MLFGWNAYLHNNNVLTTYVIKDMHAVVTIVSILDNFDYLLYDIHLDDQNINDDI